MGKPAQIPCKVTFRYKHLPDVFVVTYYRAWPTERSHVPRCARYPAGVVMAKSGFKLDPDVEDVRTEGDLITYAVGSHTIESTVELWEIWFSKPTEAELALLP